MKYLFLFACVLTSLATFGQEWNPAHSPAENQGAQKPSTEMPLPGFDLQAYLSNDLHYPDSSRLHNIEGRVIVKFIVNEDGSISNCKIDKGIDPYCDTEALRVVRMMPKWKPGKSDGKPVKVFFNLPIVFKLTD